MTSSLETFGLAPLEAMGRGIPVVALPCGGGLDDLVARGGLLLPDRAVATAADALARLLRSGAERQALRDRGRAAAAAHAPDRCLAQLEALYRALDSPDQDDRAPKAARLARR
jgi:glycosyltransferase involved in cell wall biosynthesis